MKKNIDILIIAGEISGDIHAAKLIKAIKKKLPDVTFFGIGGNEMRATGMEIFYDVKDMAVMGFIEVLRKFLFFKRIFNKMLLLIQTRRPVAVILVDYPGFNMRFAAKAHALGIKTIYYICPQVWAWNQARIPGMAKILDLLITIFPFEKKYFKNTNLRVEFSGHPLVDDVDRESDLSSLSLSWDNKYNIALLPGSRIHEIERIFPVMWEAATILEKRYPETGFIIATPSEEIEKTIREKIKTLGTSPVRWTIITDNTRQVLRQTRVAMVTSGTATIETSLMLCPMIIIYKTALLTYLLGKLLIKINNIGMVNIVAGKQVCPEFVQKDATPKAIAKAVAPLIEDTPERFDMINSLGKVNTNLGSGGAVDNAADSVIGILGREIS